MTGQPHALIVVDDLSSNGLGRAWALSLCLDALGHTSQVVGRQSGSFWSPLAGTPFAGRCLRIDGARPRWVTSLVRQVVERAQPCDYVLAVKALPGSLLVGRKVAEALDRPLIVDCDDHDLLPYLPTRSQGATRLLKSVARSLRTPWHPAPWTAVRLERLLASVEHLLVSNPALAQRYPSGTVVAHARMDQGPGAPHRTRTLAVAYVGTRRKHKGVELLRQAVSESMVDGDSLVVTDDAPADAAPHERWIGSVSISDGLDVVADADVAAVLSSRNDFSDLQLPAKLMDAMLAGRLIIASRLDPIVWALGGTGLLVDPDNLSDVVAALDKARDPQLRQELGAAARTRALELFTPAACAPALDEVINRALR